MLKLPQTVLSWTNVLPALLAAILLAATGIKLAITPDWPWRFVAIEQPALAGGPPSYERHILTDVPPNRAHSVSAIALADGRLRAFWFEGTREGAPDVRIMTSVFDGQGWSEKRPVIGPEETGGALGRYVRKLGNAVPLRLADGRLWLVNVGVGIGGWSGSRLYLHESDDEGETWHAVRPLASTPLLNFSTLVRTPALTLTGGAVALPTYQEFLGEFPEITVLDGEGHVVSKARIDDGNRAIQPFVMAADGGATAFARSNDRDENRVLRYRSTDDGETWSDAEALEIANHGDPVSVVPLPDGRLLMASVQADGGRDAAEPMTLSISADAGTTWRTVHTFRFEPEAIRELHSYPWLMIGPDGYFHLLFSWQTTRRVAHVRFNQAWLEERADR